MNYRHAFHAGNFADCMKHALLVWLVRAMQRKPAPVFFADTHAGAGQYDLGADPAERTGEWRAGIFRLLEAPPAPLAEYVALVRDLGLYPGSPRLIRALLRPEDRLACCELHPQEHAALRRLFARDSQVAVHHRDAWEALGALLPPAQRRALVLVDPPYEATDEFAHLADGLRRGHARMGHAVFVAWYPIKHRSPVRGFHDTLRASGMRDIVAAELLLREPADPARLNGCGLVVVNPPFGFEAAAADLLAALLERLGAREAGEGVAVARIADE
jgi:23S rRNA (adenine2030-N6)-methyltransferase